MTEQEKQAEYRAVLVEFRRLFHRVQTANGISPLKAAIKEMKAWAEVERILKAKIQADEPTTTK